MEDPHRQMSVEEARKLDNEIQVGDVLDIEVTPEDFGRIAAQTAKQVVVQRIREAERDILFEEFTQCANEILHRGGRAARSRDDLCQSGEGRRGAAGVGTDADGSLSHRGARQAVYRGGEENRKTPHVLISRSHPGLLRKLFELEVPEIAEGVVEIKSVAREAGHRSKVAVSSRRESVDPVGACVGHRGSRVQAVVDELRGEKIDIVRWSEDPSRYLASALSPARINEVRLEEESRSATVMVPDSQQSLAIGKEGRKSAWPPG